MFYVFLLLFSLWLVLTVVVQFDITYKSALSRFDILGLLPRWTFFAPTPAHTDIRLLVRFGNSSGLTPWNELWLSSRVDESRTYVRGLFNPYRRIEKYLSDFRNVLMEPKISPPQVRMSSEYITLLALSELAARSLGAETVQFMLAETNYTLPDQFSTILISDMHRVLTTN